MVFLFFAYTLLGYKMLDTLRVLQVKDLSEMDYRLKDLSEMDYRLKDLSEVDYR